MQGTAVDREAGDVDGCRGGWVAEVDDGGGRGVGNGEGVPIIGVIPIVGLQAGPDGGSGKSSKRGNEQIGDGSAESRGKIVSDGGGESVVAGCDVMEIGAWQR